MRYSLRILLENILRHSYNNNNVIETINSFSNWIANPKAVKNEIEFMPGRINAGLYRCSIISRLRFYA